MQYKKPDKKRIHNIKSIKRINTACKYFPCHKRLQDCTFCYCLFYPCLDKALGEYVYLKKSKEKIWSCQSCNWIHKKSVVDKILKIIRKNKNIIRFRIQ
ncbi:hypothetical protein B9J78_01315 [bacterium Unc6]|nr:hypothetical protein [bacterium Unc6]